MTFVFLIDAALTILHNSPPRMVVTELKMDVACPESCFQAESASACMQQLHNWTDTMFWESRLSIKSVVRQICQGPLEDTLIKDFASLGTLNLFTIIQCKLHQSGRIKGGIFRRLILTPHSNTLPTISYSQLPSLRVNNCPNPGWPRKLASNMEFKSFRRHRPPRYTGKSLETSWFFGPCC